MSSKLESLSNVPRTYMRSIEALRVYSSLPFGSLVGSSGLEPPTSRLSGARSNHLSYEPIQFFRCISSHSRSLTFRSWWRWWESNPWPPACRAGALPAELHPHLGLFKWIVNSEEWKVKNVGWKSFAFSSFFFFFFLLRYSLFSVTLRSLKIEQQQTYTLRKFALSHRP